MEKINIFSLKTFEFIDNFDATQLGIYFSLFLHFLILLIAIGLPDFFFKPKTITLPNIIPIEILNVAETTNLTKNISTEKHLVNEKKIIKQKKFNSSENTEIKRVDLQQKSKSKNIDTLVEKKVLNKLNSEEVIIKEKNLKKVLETKTVSNNEKLEAYNTDKIKPKLKPKPKHNLNKSNTDIKLEPKPDLDLAKKNKIIESNPKPQLKPEPDFSIASMLKDLRNEKSNNIVDQKDVEKEDDIIKEKNSNTEESSALSISEIDLLRQQLSSCWNAPAGAVIQKGMKVTISAKVQKNMQVFENSVRIVDTNLSKSNPFYRPITESAMRTLLNPECTPLKLPKDKYNLWKNLTITFDYSIMKGYS